MLQEFLEALAEKIEDAQRLEVLEIPQLRKLAVRHGKSELELHDPAPFAREAYTTDLASLNRAILDPAVCKDPEVWVDSERVYVHCDRADRHERVRMDLEFSARWRTLEILSHGKVLTPKEAVRMLRFDLNGTGPGTAAVATALARVNFTRRSDGHAHTEHGRESMGRSVEAAVQSTEAIPEFFDVQVVPWSNGGLLGLATTVRVGIYIDPEAGAVEFKTLADAMPWALNSAVSGLVSMIAEATEAPVFAGGNG